jgi:hypothetical protein
MSQFVVVNTQFSNKISMISFEDFLKPSSLSSKITSKTLQNAFENEFYQSLFFFGKSYIFGYEVSFSSFEALPLFRKCAEIDFHDSFFFYCECLDYCVDNPSTIIDINILSKHFSYYSIQQSDLNSFLARHFKVLSEEKDLNSLFIFGLCLFYGFGVKKEI